MDYISLNDGVKIPQIGFGTFQIPADGSTYRAIKAALVAGYRHIDTAAAYFNEEEVGRAIKESGIVREEIFLTTKLWLQDYGYEQGKKGIERCLRHLGTYIDLMLIHQPYGDVAGAWKAMEEYKKSEDIRSLGVSNMTTAIWRKIVPELSSTPSVNQVEFNPYCQQKELRALLSKEHVVMEAWAPLGQGSRELLREPVLVGLAKRYHKDVGQIILRFEIQEGCIVLPRSTKPERMSTNLDIFDFELTEGEMDSIRKLDKGHGIHNPDAPGVEEMLRKAFVITD